MLENLIYWLAVSSMIFFNLLCIVGIISFVMITSAISKIKNKAVEALDTAQETTIQVAQTLEDSSKSIIVELFIFIAGLFFPFKKKSRLEKFLDKISK